jgi:hypothetical protein
MPAKFGVPSKTSISQIQNKINVSVLSTDTDGNLTNTVTSTVLENIANYLSRYRMINDYVVVRPADVINIGFEISVLVDSGSQISSVANIVSTVTDEFNRETTDLGQSYLVGNLIKKLSQIDGVLNINYIKAFNKVGGNYSTSKLSDDLLLNLNTNEIDLTTGAIKVTNDQILQIKLPEIDIVVIPTTQNLSIL